MKRWLLIGLSCAALSTLTLPTSPQAQDSSVKVGGRFYQKKTVYDFSSDTISGDLTKPDGEYIEARKNVKFQRLIQLRQNFRERIIQSVNDL
ncbi:hypothetical protein L6R29_03930 [Myxococcota bacterium]|nr:hypothetical protein [Myxococcota bacterium]